YARRKPAGPTRIPPPLQRCSAAPRRAVRWCRWAAWSCLFRSEAARPAHRIALAPAQGSDHEWSGFGILRGQRRPPAEVPAGIPQCENQRAWDDFPDGAAIGAWARGLCPLLAPNRHSPTNRQSRGWTLQIGEDLRADYRIGPYPAPRSLRI